MIMLNVRGNLFLTLFVVLAATLNSAVAHALPVSALSTANKRDAVSERDICTTATDVRLGLSQLIDSIGDTVKDFTKDPVIVKLAQFDARVAAMLRTSGCTNKKRVGSSRHNKEDVTKRDGMGDVLNSVTNVLNVLGRSMKENGENRGTNNTSEEELFAIKVEKILKADVLSSTAIIVTFDASDGWYML
ncbi:hypothetical protein SISNIDRAFT_535722 [Sistotremastrum niveocremeum HHB9708]|uniref:Uncharacterized protein n=1 Tax=Sistotremastrum niveocremeum HHB9708 TaxID=1314777 RepID=A0A164NBG2_9AGAM|nr:hypothetical protein SISNIDRAFT_535722 [Sistotremastrum niveocremeum HHB9708]